MGAYWAQKKPITYSRKTEKMQSSSSSSSITSLAIFPNSNSVLKSDSEKMSIVPMNNESGTISNPFSLDFFDPEGFFFSSDLFDPFPPIFSDVFPFSGGGIFPSLETHVDWKQNSRVHRVRAVFPGFSREDVFVHIDDDNVLEISTESGKFMSKFKLPDDARRDGIKASMVNGVLNIVIPKEEEEGAIATTTRNVRSIEISGSG